MLQGFSMALTLNLMIGACFSCVCFFFSSSVLAAAERWNHKTLGALGGIKKRISNKFKTRERKMEDAGRIWPYGFLSSFFFNLDQGGLFGFY
jgi:hypothetical protein